MLGIKYGSLTLPWLRHKNGQVHAVNMTLCVCVHLYTSCIIVYLQRLLRSFRVAELQNLLRLYGQPRTGRKNDLYQRTVNMFQCHDPKQLEERIKQLYSQIQSSRYSNYSYPPPPPSSSNSDDERTLKVKSHYAHHGHAKMANLKALTPTWGMREQPYPSGATPVIHPDVKFKELPFYSIIDNILRPTALGREHIT